MREPEGGQAGTEFPSARRPLLPPETRTPGGELGARGLLPVPDTLTLHLPHAVCSGTWHHLSDTFGFELTAREWQAPSLPRKQARWHPHTPCHLVPRAPGAGPWRDAAWVPEARRLPLASSAECPPDRCPGPVPQAPTSATLGSADSPAPRGRCPGVAVGFTRRDGRPGGSRSSSSLQCPGPAPSAALVTRRLFAV